MFGPRECGKVSYCLTLDPDYRTSFDVPYICRTEDIQSTRLARDDVSRVEAAQYKRAVSSRVSHRVHDLVHHNDE